MHSDDGQHIQILITTRKQRITAPHHQCIAEKPPRSIFMHGGRGGGSVGLAAALGRMEAQRNRI